MCLMPRRPQDLSSPATMQDVCSFWEACVQANEGIPPLCMAHDNHMLQMPLTELFLGLQPLPDLPFLRHCGKGQALPIKCWPFRTLIYKNRWPVFGGNDPAHCQKNAVHALRGLRRQPCERFQSGFGDPKTGWTPHSTISWSRQPI